MSNYKTIQTKSPFLEDINSAYGFFERYCNQFRDTFKAGLDFMTLWYQFCEVNNIIPKKPWQISSDELKSFDRLTDQEIFLLMVETIGSFWKAGYNGDGF